MSSYWDDDSSSSSSTEWYPTTNDTAPTKPGSLAIYRRAANGAAYTRRGPPMKRDLQPNRALWDAEHPGLLYFQQKPTHLMLDSFIELTDGSNHEMAARFPDGKLFFVRVPKKKRAGNVYKEMLDTYGIVWEPGRPYNHTLQDDPDDEEEGINNNKSSSSSNIPHRLPVARTMNPILQTSATYRVIQLQTGKVGSWNLQLFSLKPRSKSGYAVFSEASVSTAADS